MRYKFIQHLAALSTGMRKRTTVASSLFGGVEPEGPTNPAKVVSGTDGKRQLIVDLDEDNGSDVITQITVGKTKYDLVESEQSPEERRSEVLRNKFSKRADEWIDRYGLNFALRVAELNSRLDILTSHIAIGLRVAVCTAAAVGLVVGLLEGTLSETIMRLKDEAVESSEALVEIGLAGIGIFISFAWFKQFLDDSQDVLLNRLKLRLRDQHTSKYQELVDVGDRLIESGNVKEPEDNWFYVMVEKIPLFGDFVRKILEHGYNIEFEKENWPH